MKQDPLVSLTQKLLSLVYHLPLKSRKQSKNELCFSISLFRTPFSRPPSSHRMNTSSPHVVVLPFPVQGHVNPLMNFSQKLAKDGFKITFVNTEFNHKQVVKAVKEPAGVLALKLVSIPDGFGP